MRDIYKYDYNRTPSVNQEFSCILKKKTGRLIFEAAFALNLFFFEFLACDFLIDDIEQRLVVSFVVIERIT